MLSYMYTQRYVHMHMYVYMYRVTHMIYISYTYNCTHSLLLSLLRLVAAVLRAAAVEEPEASSQPCQAGRKGGRGGLWGS